MCGYVYVCVCMCVDVWICVCACVHVCTCIWYMCVRIFMCACMCVHKPAGVLGAQAHQLDGLPSQLPFISLIGLDQVGLHQMCVCLGVYVRLGHWRLDQVFFHFLRGGVARYGHKAVPVSLQPFQECPQRSGCACPAGS